MALNIPLILGLLIVIVLIILSVKVVREYERAIVFRLGRLLGEKGPGLFVIIPLIDRIVKVDLRIRELDVPKQTVISRDNVSLDVDAVIYYKVVDSCKAIVEVENYEEATALLGQTIFRDILGQNELDTILSERDRLNQEIQTLLDAATKPWGMQVTVVTMRDVALPENMLRAIARQAEAEREKRARIILADAEYQAAQKMNEAATFYEKTPIALKLREFQTLTDIAKEKNLIVISSGVAGEVGTTAGLTKAFAER